MRCKWLLIMTGLCLLLRENYPFSNFPMYSSFSHRTYFIHLADAQGSALSTRQFGLSNSTMKKIFDRYRRQELDRFLKKHAQAGNGVTRALLAPQRLGLHDAFSLLGDAVREHQVTLLNELRELDADWEHQRATPCPQLALLQQKLAYLHKWSAQIREALHQLGV